MPTYEYQCSSCGHLFEKFQSIKDEPVKICPECHKETASRLISGGNGLIFKGSGFYITDYKNKKTSNATPAVSTGQKAKEKPDVSKKE